MKKQEYSVTEISKLKKVPYHKVIRMIKKGAFAGAYKVGHGWVVPAVDVVKVNNWKDTIREMFKKGKK